MRVEIVTECEHGEWVGPHCTMEREGRCPYYPTDTDRECYCPGGSRRVLEPGDLVDLIDKHTQAIIDSLGLKNLTVAPGASVVIDLGLPLDALTEGEQ